MTVISELVDLYYKVEGDYDTFKKSTTELVGHNVEDVSDEISSQAEMIEVSWEITLEEILSNDELLNRVKLEIIDKVQEWTGV